MHGSLVRLAAAVATATAVTIVGGLTATSSQADVARPHSAYATDRPGSVPTLGLHRISDAFQSGSAYAFQNGATGLCLDDSTQYGLRGYGCNVTSYNNGYQKWIVYGGDPYQLQNAATGLCLDDSTQYGLRGYGCNAPSYNNGYQKWIAYGSDPYQLKNGATLLCLDDSTQYGLRGYGCNAPSYNNGYQKWITGIP